MRALVLGLLFSCACTAPPIEGDGALALKGKRTDEVPEVPETAKPTPSATPTPTPTTTPTTTTTTSPPAKADECVAPAESKLQDQDLTDDQLPWKRTGGGKVVIFFETKNVNAEFRTLMEQSAVNWNKSPCLDVRLIESCQSGTNCVTVKAPSTDLDDGDDGNFDAIEKSGFTTGGHIDIRSGMTKGEKINVTIHEMGHAVGLRHRKTERVLMNGDTYDDVLASDPIDYQNLLVLYGNQK